MRCAIAEAPPEGALFRLEPKTVQVASVRADALCAHVWNLSRGESLALFRAGRVFLNGRLCESGAAAPREGDLLSVRGYGRFVYRGVLAPVVTGSILNPVPLAIFILFALAALYYFFHGLLWRVTVEEDTFTCRTMTGKESTYRYDGVRRIVPMGKSKRKMDGTRLVMRDDTVVFIDRTLYGLETLERRVRDALGESCIEEASLNPIKPLR